MQYLKLFEQFIDERRMQPIKGTPFKVYYGGKDVEGQLKWVIDSDDEEILNSYLKDEDQLWYSKAEAESIVRNWWKNKVKLFEEFKQFVFEKMVLVELETEFDIELDLYDNGKHLELSRIVIPKEERGKGLGSKVMQIIVDYADKNKKRIYLTPTKEFGASSVSRLENFYKGFGFVKKPKDDFSTKEKMIRFPI